MNKYSFGGNMITGMGGPIDAISAGIGFTNDILGNFLPKPSFNAVTSSSDYSFGKDNTAEQAKSKGKVNSKIDMVTDAIGGVAKDIPVVGDLIGNVTKLAGTGAKFAADLIKGKANDEDKLAEYMSLFRGENEAQRKNVYANANWAAEGGYLGQGDDTGVQEIKTGGTHEQNPNGGVFMGTDNQGTPNLVEEGEVIVDFPDGRKFVFTNRF
jgi:hypothetical protein